MTAADETLTRSGRLAGRRGTLFPAVHPATAGRVVLVGFVVVNLAIVEAVYATSDLPSKHPLIDVGKFFGLHVALVMVFQLLLIARLPWLDRRIGMDRLTSWHRWVGFTLLWTLILHVSFIVLGYARLYDTPVPQQVASLAGSFPVLLGMAALVVIVVVAGLSVRAARRRLQYETWHAIHVALYLAVALALVHQMFEVSTFTSSRLATAYWWSLWAFVGLALLGGRVVLPLWRNARHRLRVAAVVPESDDVVSIHLRGRDLDRMPARAGQFFVWRFLSHGRWWQANPFSLSAAPDGRSLRLTVKAVGAGSAGLRHVPVGTRVFAEGPYGAFTALHRAADATLLIAGGVGITPIRALLEELDGPIVVLYRVPTTADAVLLAELVALARMRDARLHVLTGRTGAGTPPNTPFAPANLRALVPDITARDVYVCGPPAMTDAVLRSLATLRVPRRQVHAERFSLAG
jgi:predicted ferric reductase